MRGEIDAPVYARGHDRAVIVPVTALRRAPAHGAMMDTQLLLGEKFRVYEERGPWVWGQAQSDDYVGYVPENAFAAPQDVTHRLAAQRSFIYRDRDIKSRPLMAISFGARLSVVGQEDGFAELAHGGFLYAPHMAALDDYEPDPIAVARRFIGAPYFWGGREATGLDCSALVQAALVACGFACPRDSDMQQAALGQITDKPAYGDLVFWKGHVGFIAGDNVLLHANAHHMAVAEEPFDEACARIQAAGGGAVTAIKRL